MKKPIKHRTYELVEWRKEEASSFWARVFVAGEYETCCRICREYCLLVGLCVDIKKTNYIYTGGAEVGVEVGLINYVPFSSKESIDVVLKKAIELGRLLAEGNCQWSYSVLTPKQSLFFSRRKRAS